MNHCRRTFQLMLLLCVAAISTSVSANELAQLLTSDQCGTGDQAIESRSVLIQLDALGITGPTETISVALLDGDRELLVETYKLDSFEPSATAVLEVWLGGVNSPGMRSWEPANDLRGLSIESRIDGVALAQLPLTDVLAAGEALQEMPIELVPVLAIDTIDTEPVAENEGLLVAKSTFVCPNAIPYCDYEYDACENRCYDAGAGVSQSCLQACNDNFLSCYYGEPVNRVVITPTQASQLGLRCLQKNCRDIPRTVERWRYKERKKVYTSTYCRTTGQRHNEVLTSNTVLPPFIYCFKDQPFRFCPFGQAVTGCYSNSDLCPF